LVVRVVRDVRVLASVGVAVVLLGAVAPTVMGAIQKSLVGMVGRGISGTVSYKVTNEGQSVGKTTRGVVGQGTVSGKLSLDASIAASLLGAVKGIPLTRIASGGSYVARYDVAANGDHRGLLVMTFKPGIGSLCLDFSVKYGKFVPGKTDYVPSTGTFATVGGTGKIAKIHASGRFKQGEVTGSMIEQFLGNGSLVSLTAGSAEPPSKECTAVASLAKP
jgi:hypothetical protein